VGNEIYPVVIQDDQSYPYIGLRVSGGSEDVTLDGAAGVATSIMTVGCYSPDLDQAMGLADSVRTAMQGFKGVFSDLLVMNCEIHSYKDDAYWDAPSKAWIYFRETDYSIRHRI
jgi:hypothetical protein